MTLQKPINKKSPRSLSAAPRGNEGEVIAVIADDLTGAAELGGIGLRYNLRVEIATEVNSNTKPDLLIISADTRSVKEEDAVSKIKQITKKLLVLQPQVIYKKIDSVLRGHVVAELKAQMEVMQLKRALVIPANPSLGRTIKDGQYYLRSEPIHLSSFSKDPEFPIKSSFVKDMLSSADVPVRKLQEELPSSGIVVGEVEDIIDLKAWAERIDTSSLLAGAAGFFKALLDGMQIKTTGLYKVSTNKPREPMLFVSGTTFNQSRQVIKNLQAKAGPVSYMPGKIISSIIDVVDDYEEWSNDVVKLLSSNGKAIIAIEKSASGIEANTNDLREKTACVVEKILQKMIVKEIIVEGGSTAASIIRKQNFTRLVPVQEFAPGVIRMKVEGNLDMHLTIKPGSYEWPEGIWNF